MARFRAQAHSGGRSPCLRGSPVARSTPPWYPLRSMSVRRARSVPRPPRRSVSLRYSPVKQLCTASPPQQLRRIRISNRSIASVAVRRHHRAEYDVSRCNDRTRASVAWGRVRHRTTGRVGEVALCQPRHQAAGSFEIAEVSARGCTRPGGWRNRQSRDLESQPMQPQRSRQPVRGKYRSVRGPAAAHRRQVRRKRANAASHRPWTPLARGPSGRRSWTSVNAPMAGAVSRGDGSSDDRLYSAELPQ
jgi:hypothetical protein